MMSIFSLYPVSKLDNTFPNAQFQAEGYRLFCMDKNKFGGVIILFLKENIPGKILNSHKFLGGFKIIYFKFSISNKK